MLFETYELTLKHYVSGVGGKRVQLEEPMSYQVTLCDADNKYIMGCKNNLIDELFFRLREQVICGEAD